MRDESLIEAARTWAEDDPDPVTREELLSLLARCDARDSGAGDPVSDRDVEAAYADLADRFSGLLEFGTAGLRGRLGAGPNRMNRAVVIRAAAGLTSYLHDLTERPYVVVGYDARYGSAQFARDTCAVVVAAGGRAVLLPSALPTPVLAYAVRRLGADAGVMVTASHNPPQDNGYKVYLGDGSQIVPPVDADIKARIDAVPSVASVPRAEDGWEIAGPELLEGYVDAVAGLVHPDCPRDLRIVHTSLHGVGDGVMRSVLVQAGFPAPYRVASQALPDPDFPTVAFPNPEEPGAIDAAIELASDVVADIVVASDPDADRCAVAVRDPAAATPDAPEGWRMLRGDELGALLGAHMIARGVGPDDVLARSIVSSRLLGAMARAAGCGEAETLTGFKWISRAPGLVYGYEEAIGYCVAPDLVRDKDGISAGLMACELASWLAADGLTLLDLLDDLALRHGVYATDAFSVRVSDLSLIGQVMSRLRATPPTEAAGVAVGAADDLAEGVDGLPPTDGLRYVFADDSRVIVRPSGTEPKLKVYLEAIVPVAGGPDGLPTARTEAARRLGALRSAFEEFTAV